MAQVNRDGCSSAKNTCTIQKKDDLKKSQNQTFEYINSNWVCVCKWMSKMTGKTGLKEAEKIERKILHKIMNPKFVDGQYKLCSEKIIIQQMNDSWSWHGNEEKILWISDQDG